MRTQQNMELSETMQTSGHFSDDSSYCLLCSLEDLNDDGTLKRKADMFTKRTIKKAVAVRSVETASEALALSLNEKAKVDLPYMAQLTGETEEKIKEELRGVIFQNPLTDQWENGDEYLSGNVREKLNTARTFCRKSPGVYSKCSCPGSGTAERPGSI